MSEPSWKDLDNVASEIQRDINKLSNTRLLALRTGVLPGLIDSIDTALLELVQVERTLFNQVFRLAAQDTGKAQKP